MTDNMLEILNRITQYNIDNKIKDVSISADSINGNGERITTILLHRFPKCLQAEYNTHGSNPCGLGVLSGSSVRRNSASARAINKKKYIDMIIADPYIPIFTLDKKGMSGDVLDNISEVQRYTKLYIDKMYIDIAYVNDNYQELHKQNINAMLDQYIRIPIITTSTNWEYFFKLRCAQDVNPEFRRIALCMQSAYNNSVPRRTDEHIPWITESEEHLDLDTKFKISTTRSAFISYNNHTKENILDLSERVVGNLRSDCHESPLDHAAISDVSRVGIYKGWREYRYL